MTAMLKIFLLSMATTALPGNITNGTGRLLNTPALLHPQELYARKPDADKRNALPKKTAIYLTFDDGPSDASFFLSNMSLADSIPLTMFVIGSNVFMNRGNSILYQLYQLNPLIETGNHSFSHANKHYHAYYDQPEEVVKDFHINADTLGLSSKIARLPGRNTWRINGKKRTDFTDDSTAADILSSEGYRIFGWDIEWKYNRDSVQIIQSAATVAENIKKMARSGNAFTAGHIIILCHEYMFTNDSNRIKLDSLIHTIKQMPGYRFHRLSDYPVSFNHSFN